MKFKLLEKLKSWSMARMTRELDRRIQQDIQVYEFDGRLYISHNGVPVIRVDNLNITAPEAVQLAREDCKKWLARYGG